MALFDDIFSGVAGVAKTEVDLFGRSVTYRRWQEPAGGYNPLLGSSAGAYMETSVTCTPFCAYKKDSPDDTSVLAGDLRTLVSPVEVTWKIVIKRDQIVDPITSKIFDVVNYRTVNTGDADALYILQLRVAS
jgi:hypothetical protein